MSRRSAVNRGAIEPDPKFGSIEVSRLIRMTQYNGKKTVARRIIYEAMETIGKKTNEDPVGVLKKAIENARPRVEVRSRRIGGANYQVPQEVNHNRSLTLAFRWMLTATRKKKGKPMAEKLASEILDAWKGEGDTVKRKEEVHKMAEANRAFAHYRW